MTSSLTRFTSTSLTAPRITGSTTRAAPARTPARCTRACGSTEPETPLAASLAARAGRAARTARARGRPHKTRIPGGSDALSHLSTPTPPAGGTADGRPARKLLASTALACVMLSGCAGGKIFEPYDADKTSVSMDARQRVILSVDRTGPDGVKRRIVCAEPSPDTIAAAAASAGLTGGVSGIPEAPPPPADA